MQKQTWFRVEVVRGVLAFGVGALLLVAGCDSAPPPDMRADSGRGGTDGGPPRDAGRSDAGPAPCADGCLVGATCYAAGAVDPTNACAVCAPAVSGTSFSPASDGSSCDDGAFCTTGDVCTAGVCGGAARSCDDGISCNGAEVCSEAAAACEAGAPTCEGDEVCDAISGACVVGCTGCLIGTTCYGEGQVNPLDPCEVCDVASARDAFSPNDGGSCDDGSFCTVGDVCGDGVCAGTARDCADGVACNGDEACDEDANVCVGGISTCAAEELCDAASDSCVVTCTGCVIDGSCFGAGQRNPANQCEVCAPMLDRSAWSANDGASCDDGLFCTTADVCAGTTCGGSARSCDDGVACNGSETCDEGADACAPGTSTCAGATLCSPSTDTCVTTCTGCVIGGGCYAPTTTNPTNACQACVPSSSTTAWSARTGAACDDGLFCTVGEVCSAAATCGAGVARVCGDGVSCNGAETCNETTDRCVAGTTTCASGTVCDAAADTCRATCSGCVIAGVCHASGSTNPANQCQTCAPATTATAWSPRTGAACDDALYCTTGETCSAVAACTGGSARVCSDGVTCNGTETCNETTDRCDTGTPTCPAGSACDVSTNMCSLTCGSGQSACGGVCTSTAYDPANCGMCGNACALREACVSGVCRALLRPPPGAYAITFAPESTAGTAVTLGDDTTSGLLPIGFTFRYFGTTYTQFNISSNGFIGFTAGMSQGCCSGSAIPTADGLDGFISAVWTDLDPRIGGTITYETRGAVGSRRLVVSYTALPHYSVNSQLSTFQIILFEGTDRIEIHTTSTGGPPPGGYLVTQGAEDPTGATAYFMPGRSAGTFSLTNDGVEIYTD